MQPSNTKNYFNFNSRFLPLVIGSIACIISLLFFGLLIEQNKKEQKELLHFHSKNLADNIIIDLNRRSQALKRMAGRWSIHQGLTQQQFETDAANMIKDERGYHALEWIDENLIIRWVVPLQGNESIIGANLNNEPVRKKTLEHAYKHATTTMTPPITLAQGGEGFILYFPIFTADNFSGFIVAVFKAQDWLNELIQTASKDNQLNNIYSTVMLQDSILFNNNPEIDNNSSLESNIQRTIYNNVFTVKLSQPEPPFSKLVNKTSLMFLITGMTFSILVAGITALVQRTSSNIIRIKKSKSELQNEKQRLASIIQGINAGTWEWNLQSRQAIVNETWAKLIGYQLQELEPITIDTWEKLTHPEDHQVSVKKLQAHLDGQSPSYEVEIRMKHKKGHWVWIQDIGQVITRTNNGKPLMMYGTHTDISITKKTAHELQQANQGLQNAVTKANAMAAEAAIANKAKSEFLASMSHEIRTPMNGIIGMLSLLMREELTEKQTHFATLALNSSKSLLTIINDILDFSKIEAGKMELEAIEFDIHKFFSEACAPLALRAQEKGLELIIDYNGIPPCKIIGDPGRLRQVIINLVGNSIKFTESGFITITPQLIIEDDIVNLKCTISDTGIGIPNDKLNLLFESFTQVDTSTTRKYGGTGLGLAICQRLCELMHGKIIVSSQIGAGSDFTFYTRLKKCPEPAKQPPWIDLKNHHILVVDNCAPQREQIAAILQSWQAKTSEAQNSEDALNILSKQNIQNSIVIINNQLPYSSGTQLALKIEQLAQCQNQYRILLTSQGEGGNNQEFIKFGFNATITKPVSPSSLFNTLANILAGNSLSSDSLISLDSGNSFSKPRVLTDKTCRVLLVEDNPINQEVAQGLLQDLGLTVSLANNGNEAIRALSSAPIDIPPFEAILMDCQMPVMDGYEATRQIRAKAAGEKYVNIPIIAMTANAMTGDKEKCLQAGMNDYVSKPIDPDVLEKTLRKNISLNIIDETERQNSEVGAINYEPLTISPKDIPDTNATPKITPDKTPLRNEEIDPNIWNKQDVLRRVKNKTDRLKLLINMFIEDIPPKIENIIDNIQQQNYSEAKALIHSVKGVSANLGGIALQQQCLKLEEILMGEQTPNTNEVIKEAHTLKANLNALLDVLKNA